MRSIIQNVGRLSLALSAVGCASVGKPMGSMPAVPVAHPAFAAPSDAQISTPLVWIPEWRMYLHDGDVVYYGGWHYSYRSGQWYVSRSEDGPWTAVATREPRTSRPGPSVRAPAAAATRIVPVALKLVGAPYRWGGGDPRGFDCSGFVMYVYGRAGTSLPHGAERQYKLGIPVSRDELRPGDIVFFDRLRHNGIYIGDGQFVHASKSGDVVKVSRLDEQWFEHRWVGARRLAIADRGSSSDD